jgi:hypothetical protein
MAPRSKIVKLPEAVKIWLDKALIDNKFGEYELLSVDLKARGYDISKSAIHRYGKDFESRLGALRMASEQAKAIVQSAPDEDGSVSEALTRLVQEKLFQSLLDFQIDPDKPLNIASAAKAVAELSRATVTQKKWQAEVREKVNARLVTLEKQAEGGGKAGFDLATLKRVREEIYGIM